MTRQNSLEYFQLINSIEDYGIFILDLAGRIISWNKGAANITGYTEDEVLNTSFSRFFIADETNSDRLERIINTTLSEGRYEEENWLKNKSAKSFWATVVISAVNTGHEITSLVVVMRDLSERKLIRDLLQQSEEKLRLMIDSVKDYGIFMLDPEGKITSWNKGAEQIKGYQSHEIIGQHFSKFYLPEDKDTKPAMALKTASSEGRLEDEGWRLRKNGSKFWGNVVISAVKDQTGKLRGFTKVTRDLTERKLVEESLRKSEQRLSIANQELEAFSYSVSHDLRAPLRAISGFSRIFEEDHSENLTETQNGLLKRIRNSADRMSQLIDGLLRLAKIGRQQLAKQDINIKELVTDTVNDLKQELSNRNIEISIEALPHCMGDQALIKQVFANLISNAFKFTSKCDVAVIKISGEEKNENIVYLVQDNGAGFEMEYADKLFGVFQRLHQAEDFPGTGVGLSIVQRIIHRHEGKMWAEGEVGKGARFYFSLPKLNKNLAK